MKERKGKFARLFSWYPAESLIRPGVVEKLVSTGKSRCSQPADGQICIQCVPDRFFFLLFNLICQALRQHTDTRVELIVVRAISGAVGVGVLAAIKRWSVLTGWWLSQWVRAWGEGKDGIAYRCAAIFQPFSDLRDWRRALTLWKAFRTQKDDFNLALGGIEVGDLIIDSYLRFRPSPRFDAHDPFVRYIIWQALRDVRQANRYFSHVKPRFYLSSYSSYIEHGITARTALKYGVPVYTFGDLARFGKRLSVQDPYHAIDYSQFRTDFERLDRHEERLEKAEAQLKMRLEGGIDAGTSYMKKSAYGVVIATMPPDFEGAVVVFLHDFYDNYNAYPNLIFCDFWRWICFTIETLQAGNIKFYIKPHPNQIDLSDAVMVDLQRKYPYAKWLPAGLCNAYLVQAGMLCGVTAYGTVAHELAYLGVPTIGYGRHPHHSFQFCRTASSREEYKAMLETPEMLPLDKVEMKRQALMFYYMRNLNGLEEDIALRQSFIRLWRTCNVDDGTDKNVLDSLYALYDQPGFRKFIFDLTKH